MENYRVIQGRPLVCAIIPAYKVKAHVIKVVADVLDYVDHVVVVDDSCPEFSGALVEETFPGHSGVSVVYLPENLGVGGAVVRGYVEAFRKGYKILVKVDGDGQMNPALIPHFVQPIADVEADYAKGNRFFDVEYLREMPKVRLVGNAGLSFLTKLSTGYWQIMDPTNGFTALHASVLPWLKLDKLDKRYFFESDMLYQLGLLNAQVVDIPMAARYGEETSNLSVGKSLFSFAGKHLARTGKRIFYQYFLRGFNLASLYLLSAVPLLLFALFFGVNEWRQSIATGIPATPGSIMLAALPALVGIQMLLNFFGYDMTSRAAMPISRQLPTQDLTIGTEHGR